MMLSDRSSSFPFLLNTAKIQKTCQKANFRVFLIFLRFFLFLRFLNSEL